MPTISIMVAKNGPAEKAGSILKRFRINGIALPSVTETKTIIAKVKLTTILSHNTPLVKYTRVNAVTPRIHDKKEAIINSRLKNFLTLFCVNSPEAIPQIATADV